MTLNSNSIWRPPTSSSKQGKCRAEAQKVACRRGLLQFYTPTEVENPLGGTLTVYDQTEGFPTQPAGYFDNNPYAYVDYDAVIVGVEKRFKGGSMFRANYTWSKAFGTTNQDGDPLQASAQSGGFMWWNDPNTTATGYTEGYLEEDRTHQIKVQGIAMLPYGFSLSCNYIGSTGTPYTRNFYYPLSVLGVNRFLAEPRGAQRYPFVHYLDLRIEKAEIWRIRLVFSFSPR